eukprot:635112-Amphidinium_carterae.1
MAREPSARGVFTTPCKKGAHMTVFCRIQMYVMGEGGQGQVFVCVRVAHDDDGAKQVRWGSLVDERILHHVGLSQHATSGNLICKMVQAWGLQSTVYSRITSRDSRLGVSNKIVQMFAR